MSMAADDDGVVIVAVVDGAVVDDDGGAPLQRSQKRPALSPPPFPLWSSSNPWRRIGRGDASCVRVFVCVCVCVGFVYAQKGSPNRIRVILCCAQQQQRLANTTTHSIKIHTVRGGDFMQSSTGGQHARRPQRQRQRQQQQKQWSSCWRR